MWRSYASATALSTAKNYIMQSDSAFTHAINGVDQVFDITEALSQAAPRDNLLMPEYMSDEYDAHPNGKAGPVIAAALLSLY